MQKQNELIKERLKNVMMGDRIEGFETLLTVLKSDLSVLLGNYMHLGAEGLKIQLEVKDNGEYILNITASTDRLIEPGKMLF